MKCPHCTASVHESWSDDDIAFSNGDHAWWRVGIMECPACSKAILRLGKSRILNNDAIRNFGNFAAQKITDQTSLQVIDVEPTEAEYCLDVLDSVFDHYYVRPAQAKRVKDALNVKLAAAKKPPV